MIYLFCFIISAGFAFFASRAENRTKFYILSFFSIAVMVALAGFRDYTVGTDTYNYLNKQMYWGGAVSADSLWDYFKFYFPLGYGEPLFAILVGVIAQLTGNFTIFLIVCHTIILICVYIGIFRFKNYINPAFVLLVYYLLYYNHTLNMTRQYIAVSIVFCFLADIPQNKIFRFCIAVLVAILFHTTAILALIIPFIYFFLYKDYRKIKVSMYQRKLALTVIVGMIVIFFPVLVNLLVNIGILNSRYLFFLNNKDASPTIIVMAMVIIGLVAADFFKDKIKKKCQFYDFYFMSSAVYLILLLLTYSLVYGRRVAFYMSMVDLITIGLIESCQDTEKKQRVTRIAILTIIFIYWIYTYVLSNASQTFPYVLGI